MAKTRSELFGHCLAQAVVRCYAGDHVIPQAFTIPIACASQIKRERQRVKAALSMVLCHFMALQLMIRCIAVR